MRDCLSATLGMYASGCLRSNCFEPANSSNLPATSDRLVEHPGDTGRGNSEIDGSSQLRATTFGSSLWTISIAVMLLFASTLVSASHLCESLHRIPASRPYTSECSTVAIGHALELVHDFQQSTAPACGQPTREAYFPGQQAHPCPGADSQTRS